MFIAVATSADVICGCHVDMEDKCWSIIKMYDTVLSEDLDIFRSHNLSDICLASLMQFYQAIFVW